AGSAAANLNGTYYSAPAANIRSLTIRGGYDNETIQILGNLGVGPITIDGRGGTNTIVIGAPNAGDLSDVRDSIVVTGDAGGTSSLIVNDLNAPAGRSLRVGHESPPSRGWITGWDQTSVIRFTNLRNVTLNGGSFNDSINVWA